jgi:hypothetical protein
MNTWREKMNRSFTKGFRWVAGIGICAVLAATLTARSLAQDKKITQTAGVENTKGWGRIGEAMDVFVKPRWKPEVTGWRSSVSL